MKFAIAIVCLGLGLSSARAVAEPPVRDPVLRPSDRAINARGERQTNIEAVEAARDRGDGRLSDPWTWALDRIDAYQGRSYVPGRDFQLFDQERDRQFRIEAGQSPRGTGRAVRHIPPADAPGEPADLGIVPGDLVSRGDGGLSPLAAQLYEDEQTLARADADFRRMLEQLDEAETRELSNLRARLEREGRGGEFDATAAKVRSDYAKWRGQARADHVRTRSRLIFKPVPTAKEPSTRPATTTRPVGAAPQR